MYKDCQNSCNVDCRLKSKKYCCDDANSDKLGLTIGLSVGIPCAFIFIAVIVFLVCFFKDDKKKNGREERIVGNQLQPIANPMIEQTIECNQITLPAQ